MPKPFLDSSGLALYTQLLKDGTLKVGRAQDASYSQDASVAFFAEHSSATGILGIIPLGNLPHGALERIVKVENKAARLALTSEQVQLGDTVQELDTKLMYIVVDESKLGTEDAFVEYTAGSAVHALYADDASTSKIAHYVEWDNVGNKPTEYTPIAHDGAKVISILTYDKSLGVGDVSINDSLPVALAKLENKAEHGFDTSISADVIQAIIDQTWVPNS